MYIACPDSLSTRGQTSQGVQVGFIESDKILTIIFYLFTSEVKILHLSS